VVSEQDIQNHKMASYTAAAVCLELNMALVNSYEDTIEALKEEGWVLKAYLWRVTWLLV